MKSTTPVSLLLLIACLIAPYTLKADNSIYGPQEQNWDGVGRVAFTFDCAQWGDKGLDHILQTMEEKGVTGSFFCTGKFFERNKEGMMKIVNAGHEIVNHSYEHDRKNSVEECERVADIFRKQSGGHEMVKIFRVPYLDETGVSWPYFASKGWLKGYVSIITCDALPDFKYITDQQFLNNFAHWVKNGSYRRLGIQSVYKHSGPGHINGASILMHIDGYRFHLIGPMIDIVKRQGYLCTTHSAASAVYTLGAPTKRPDEKTLDEMLLSSLNKMTPRVAEIRKAKELEEQKHKEAIKAHAEMARQQSARPDADKMAAALEAFEKGLKNQEVGLRGNLSITFDCDDYSPIALQKILNTLKENEVRSTFYITERYLNDSPAAVKAILEHGHEVANRGQSYFNEAESVDTIASFAHQFKERTGVEMVKLFRAHKGAEENIDWEGLSEEGWDKGYVSLDTNDFDDEYRGISDGYFMVRFKIYMTYVPQKRVDIINVPPLGSGTADGAVVQFHPAGYRYHKLDEMIRHIRSLNYSIIPQSEMMAIGSAYADSLEESEQKAGRELVAN